MEIWAFSLFSIILLHWKLNYIDFYQQEMGTDGLQPATPLDSTLPTKELSMLPAYPHQAHLSPPTLPVLPYPRVTEEQFRNLALLSPGSACSPIPWQPVSPLSVATNTYSSFNFHREMLQWDRLWHSIQAAPFTLSPGSSQMSLSWEMISRNLAYRQICKRETNI